MAFVRPNEMAPRQNFNIVIYGQPGSGKTTFACSAKKPLVIDWDNGILRVRADHRPEIIIAPDSYEEVLRDLESPELRDIETIIMDTGGGFISYLQEWAKKKDIKNKQSDGTISIRGFGRVKSEFLHFYSVLAQLNKNIITIFHSVEEKDANGEKTNQRLLCEGAAKNLIWNPCDFGGFITFVGNERRVYFAPNERFYAKRCFGIKDYYTIPDVSPAEKNDLLERIINEARENIRRDADNYSAAHAVYADAIEVGREIIDGITDPESAKTATESLKKISHALTSEKELRAALANKLKSLRIVWDKAAQEYVTKEAP